MREAQAYRLSRGEGKSLWVMGALFTFKAVGRDTSGSLTVAEMQAPPGFTLPIHTHRERDESFYVIEGDIAFYYGREKFYLRHNGFVYVPRGIRQALRVDGESSARLLIHSTPSGLEDFIREIGEPAVKPVFPHPSKSVDLKALSGIAARFGIDMEGMPER